MSCIFTCIEDGTCNGRCEPDVNCPSDPDCAQQAAIFESVGFALIIGIIILSICCVICHPKAKYS